MVETTYNVPNCPATKLAPSLALLSDSHNCDPQPILSSLRAHTPALILIAGDFTYGPVPADGKLKMEESTAAMDLITGCVAIAPTYLSLGNHKWMLHASDLRIISSTGAVVLDNTLHNIQPCMERGKRREVLVRITKRRYQRFLPQIHSWSSAVLGRKLITNKNDPALIFNKIPGYVISLIDGQDISFIDFHSQYPYK